MHHARRKYGPVVLEPKTCCGVTSLKAGCLHDYACHAIDLVHYLMGRPSSVGGVVLNQIFSQGVEDEVYASLYFADGATGQIAANWSDEAYRKMSIRGCLWGTNGTIIADRRNCSSTCVTKWQAKFNKGWNIRYIPI